MRQHRVVIVTGDGASFLLQGDPDEGTAPYEVDEDGDDAMQALPALLSEGWSVVSVSPGAATMDEDPPTWLAVIERDA